MATLTTLPTATVAAPAGGGFLIDDIAPADVFTPEDFSEEQRQVMATAERFMTDEVLPAAEQCEQKDSEVMLGLLRKAADLGFLGVLVPEKYDGLETGPDDADDHLRTAWPLCFFLYNVRCSFRHRVVAADFLWHA